MGVLSSESQRRLTSVHPHLVIVAEEVVKQYDCIVHYNGGHRSKETQDSLYPTYSKVKFPNSYHNVYPSMALDFGPWYKSEPHIDWNDKEGFYHFAGYVRGVAHSMGIPLVWGGDWDSDYDLDDQTFYDLVHFQLDIHKSPEYMDLWMEHLSAHRNG